MGTRSNTIVLDEWNNEPILNMYRQYDGYLEGHGIELLEFLATKNMTNGMAVGQDHTQTANGMGCLAAQIVARFKGGAGGIYIYPTKGLEPLEAHYSAYDGGEDYTYTVYNVNGELWCRCYSWGRIIFNKTVNDAVEFIQNINREEDY